MAGKALLGSPRASLRHLDRFRDSLADWRATNDTVIGPGFQAATCFILFHTPDDGRSRKAMQYALYGRSDIHAVIGNQRNLMWPSNI